MVRVLVCGGRHVTDHVRIYKALYDLHQEHGFSALIEGDAKGVDRIAGEWARRTRLPLLVFPADWARHGNAAGPIRNQRMIDEGKPDLVVAFPGGSGTADMVRRAEAAGIRVIRVPAPAEAPTDG